MKAAAPGGSDAADSGRGAALRRIADRAEYRLTAHFFHGMFDFGVLTPAGADAFTHLLLGAVGALIALGLGLTRIYGGKYAALSGAGTPAPYREALLGDDLFLIALPMLIVALLTLLVSHAAFPDERDVRILGPLPVRRTTVFTAKLRALVFFIGMLGIVVHLSLLPLVLLTSFNRFSEHAVAMRVVAWALASTAASGFAFLAIVAVIGVSTLALSRTRALSLTALTKSAILTALILAAPLVFQLPDRGRALATGEAWLRLVPPAWFVGVEQVILGHHDSWFGDLAARGVVSLLMSAVLVSIFYVVLFKRFEHLLLRPVRASGSLSRPAPRVRTGQNAAARFFAFTPACRGIYRFTTTTLRRSQLHQGVLLGLVACGASLEVTRLLGADVIGALRGSSPSRSLIDIATWTPFAVMFFCGVSVRAALALPLEHRANWIFRLTEDPSTRPEQMRAVTRAVTLWVTGVPLLATIPLLVLVPSQALTSAGVVMVIGVLFVHAVLVDWRRIPFTCSYLPGKRLIAHTLVLGFAAFVLFTGAAALIVRLAAPRRNAAAYVIVAGLTVGWVLNRLRLARWRLLPLLFEDEVPDRPLQLEL
jgi:hypothetical protein